MLPTVIVDYKMDFRYFLIFAGKRTDSRAVYTERNFIDDMEPPIRKHFTVDQYFRRMKRFYEEDENFSEYEIDIDELKQYYEGYKHKKMGAGDLLIEFYETLGCKEGFKSFWGLAVCHISSHSRELHEVLRRGLFKYSFKNGDCIINQAAPVPKGKTDKWGKPLKPQIKYSYIFKLLTQMLEDHMKNRKDELPLIDIRSLNQAISKIYEIDRHDLLQGKRLKMYIGPETRDLIGECFFCPKTQIDKKFSECKMEDLVYVQIYWSIIWLMMSGKNPGITPGFNGFFWIKDIFPERFNFIKLAKSKFVNEMGHKTADFPGLEPEQTRGRLISKPIVQQSNIPVNEDHFPSLSGGKAKTANVKNDTANFPKFGNGLHQGTKGQGLTLMQQMAMGKRNPMAAKRVNNAGARKRKRAAGGVTAQRLGLGINKNMDWTAPQRRKKNKRVVNNFPTLESYSNLKKASHATQKAIKRYHRPEFEDLELDDEDNGENRMIIQSTHTGPIARPVEETNELDELYGNKPSNNVSNIKEAFPTLGGGATASVTPGVNQSNPIFKPRHALNVKKGKKKGKHKKQNGQSNQNFPGQMQSMTKRQANNNFNHVFGLPKDFGKPKGQILSEDEEEAFPSMIGGTNPGAMIKKSNPLMGNKRKGKTHKKQKKQKNTQVSKDDFPTLGLGGETLSSQPENKIKKKAMRGNFINNFPEMEAIKHSNQHSKQNNLQHKKHSKHKHPIHHHKPKLEENPEEAFPNTFHSEQGSKQPTLFDKMSKKKAKRWNAQEARPWVELNPDVDESTILNKKGKTPFLNDSVEVQSAKPHITKKKKKHKGKAVIEKRSNDEPSISDAFGTSLANTDFTDTAPLKNNAKKRAPVHKKKNITQNKELFPTLGGALSGTASNMGPVVGHVARKDFDINEVINQGKKMTDAPDKNPTVVKGGIGKGKKKKKKGKKKGKAIIL